MKAHKQNAQRGLKRNKTKAKNANLNANGSHDYFRVVLPKVWIAVTLHPLNFENLHNHRKDV